VSDVLPAACKSGAIRFGEGMFPYVALRKAKAWQSGYEGVELMILDKQVRHDPHVRVIKSSVLLCLTGR
jgi:hypothetical protein